MRKGPVPFVLPPEPIGPRERLQPGESASFTEDWWLLSFPFPKEGESINLQSLDTFVKNQTAAH